MHILLCGAHGFLGRHLCAALEDAGHHVIRGVRHIDPQEIRPTILIDYANDTDRKIWLQRLQALGAIDIVINAVGILNESANARFATLHRDAPIALFDAAAELGVQGIVQMSALGGQFESAIHPDSTSYMRTKRQTDAHLMQLATPHLILRPSLLAWW